MNSYRFIKDITDKEEITLEINKKEHFIYLSVKEVAERCCKADEEYYNLGLVNLISEHLIEKYQKTYEELAK